MSIAVDIMVVLAIFAFVILFASGLMSQKSLDEANAGA